MIKEDMGIKEDDTTETNNRYDNKESTDTFFKEKITTHVLENGST